MITDATNTRRATPERVLWVFAAFTLLAAAAAVRDSKRRSELENATRISQMERP